MITLEEDLGEVAGRIWRFLDQEGSSSLSSLNDAISEPRSRVNMGIGWLAREDKLEFNEDGRGVSVDLK